MPLRATRGSTSFQNKSKITAITAIPFRTIYFLPDSLYCLHSEPEIDIEWIIMTRSPSEIASPITPGTLSGQSELQNLAPASESMDFKQKILPRPSVNREKYILDRLGAFGTVVHLGCSDAPFTKARLETKSLLHFELLKKCPSIVGFDLSTKGIQLLRKADPDGKYICGNAESLDQHFDLNSVDLIVAGEIVEHLSNPGAFFAASAKILRPDGVLLITIPNAFGMRRYIHGLFGVENYHPDHTFYFSENTIGALASRFGFSIFRSRYYASMASTSWLKRALYFAIETLPAFIFGNHFLDGLVIELKKEL